MEVYDLAIIGAGINGCSLAYEFHKRGEDVLVFEQEEVASGGSGAAGAFINPKISKSGPLKELIETAYLYSMDFYKKNFIEHTNLAPLLHISKYENENDKVEYFKQHSSLKVDEVPQEIQKHLKEYAKSFSSVYLKDNAIVEAKDVCAQMLSGIRVEKLKVQDPHYTDGLWHVGSFKAKKLVLLLSNFKIKLAVLMER